MGETAFFDPVVEGLLREAAADPRSCLLRVPRATVLTGLFERENVVSPNATGASPAERELVRVHREELAKLLREACILRLYAHPAARRRAIRHDTATRVMRLPNARAWRERTWRERLMSHAPRSIEDLELLDRCIDPEGLERASVEQLAAASLRLRSTTQARIYAAHAAVFGDRPSEALMLLASAASFNESAALEASISCNFGAALSDLGRLDDARDAYARAARSDDPPVIAVIYWLVFAIRSASPTDVSASGRVLDELVTANHPAVIEATDGLRDQRVDGTWRLDANARRVARAAIDQCGPAASEVVDAVLC